MLIKIWDWRSDEVIFGLDKENNTIKDTVEEAVRQRVDLSFASLCDEDLHDADLRGANLYRAYFEGSDLSGADLTGANIKNCFFDKAILNNTIIPDFPMACPEKGSFIGYKKISWTAEYGFKRSFIVKLEIPEDAKRSSSTSNKCRCSKAKVLEIRDMMSGETIESITNKNMFMCVYEVGEYVYSNAFDECRWNECSSGIHFFMTEKEALDY